MREQGNGNFAAKEPSRTLISYTLPTNMPPASIMKTKRRLLTSCRPSPADQEQGEATDRMEDDRFSIRLGWTTQRDYSLSTLHRINSSRMREDAALELAPKCGPSPNTLCV